VIASPEALATSPFSSLKEKVEDSARRIGNKYWLDESRIWPTPLKAMGFSLCEKMPLEVEVNGSKKFLD